MVIVGRMKLRMFLVLNYVYILLKIGDICLDDKDVYLLISKLQCISCRYQYYLLNGTEYVSFLVLMKPHSTISYYNYIRMDF